MIINDIENIKGFMPAHEGEALYKWSKEFSKSGPIIEIGTYCGKSTIYLGFGANENNEVVFTIDHHSGSEEHQIPQGQNILLSIDALRIQNDDRL